MADTSTFPRICRVETFIISIPRDVPYMGPLGPGESINERGYLIRHGNRSIYPSTDMSVLIKITADDGTIGWGETYGIVAPNAVTSIIDDVLGPVVIGRDPRDVVTIQEDLYDLMRVRGFFGGYYVDSIAGVDIAIWDLFGKLVDQPVVKLLGGQRLTQIPAYVSGLPGKTLDDRLRVAKDFKARGFNSFKFHSAVSFDGIVEEMRVLREGLGSEVKLMVDLHWKFTAQEAIQLIEQITPYRPYFVEAPCQPEDIGIGIFQAASLHATAALPNSPMHEYQHSIFDRNLQFVNTTMACTQGAFTMPEGAGLGIEPNDTVWQHVRAKDRS